MDQQREALLLFRGSYGRLCTLGAKALTEGYHPKAVTLAMRGEGNAQDATLKEVRRARAVVNLGLEAARGHGNDTAAIVEAGQYARDGVQEEWDVTFHFASAPTIN